MDINQLILSLGYKIVEYVLLFQGHSDTNHPVKPFVKLSLQKKSFKCAKVLMKQHRRITQLYLLLFILILLW